MQHPCIFVEIFLTPAGIKFLRHFFHKLILHIVDFLYIYYLYIINNYISYERIKNTQEALYFTRYILTLSWYSSNETVRIVRWKKITLKMQPIRRILQWLVLVILYIKVTDYWLVHVILRCLKFWTRIIVGFPSRYIMFICTSNHRKIVEI